MGRVGFADSILFDSFRLDLRGGCLYRLDQGGVATPVVLGSRALDLLGLLVERQGELVSKDEIMAAVWPGRVVEEANLNVQISKLRHILDQNREQGSCIQTIPGRGYCFVARAKQPDTDACGRVLAIPESSTLRRPRLSIVADRDLTSAESPRASIAVLHSNVSDGPEQQDLGRFGATPMDVAGWLCGLGLEQYGSAFYGTAASSTRSAGSPVLSLSTWGMECRSISVIRKRTETMPSGRCGPGSP